MNYFLKKRVQSGFTRSDMANELGINYQRYVAIEKGSVKMPSNLLNKFNEIINRGKENEITKIENSVKADEFWNEVSQKDETGRYVLVQKMHEFNIKNMQELVYLLGYKSCGTVWNYLQGRNVVGDEFKKRLYNFFNNELNVQIPVKAETTKKRTYTKHQAPVVNKRLDRYYEKTDFKKILKNHQITNTQIATAIGVDNSVVSRMTSKSYKPGYKTLQKVKDYLDSIIEDQKNTYQEESNIKEKKNSTQYISKQKLIDECKKEIESNNAECERLTNKIKELQSKNELLTKFVDLVNALQ